MNFQQKEAAILRAMASAKSLKDQAALAEELQSLRAEHTATLREERDLQWADMVVEATLTPAWRGSQHTAASDWMDEVAPVDTETSHQAMMAEASVWFNRTSAEVRADQEEFEIQAQGMARRVAGKYGEGASAAAQAFIDYAAFLLQREAASGLDQIQQTIDPNNQPKTTQMPTDTFDTFGEEVAPGNAPGKPSTDNPLLAEIAGTSPFGDHYEARPSEHDESGTQVGHYGPGPVTAGMEGSCVAGTPGCTGSAGSSRPKGSDTLTCSTCHGTSKTSALVGDDDDPFGSLFSRSLALNYTGSLADWTERLAKESKKCKGADCDNDAAEKGLCASCKSKEEKGKKEVAKDFKESVKVEHLATVTVEGASTLDQIQQTTAPDGVTEKPTPLPGQVMFPITPGFEGEENTGAEGGEGPSRHVETPAPQQGAKHADKRHKTKKEEEDERGGYNPAQKDSDDDSDDEDDNSKEARLIASAAMAFEADYFGASDEPHKVPGHQRDGYDTETYNSPRKAEHDHDPRHELKPSQDQVEPKSLHRHDARPAEHTTTNGPRKDNLSVGGSLDYTKAFKYAANWKPGTPLVQSGSDEFEVGLYDGIKANAAANRKAWVAAHKKQSVQYPYLADRLVAHARRTAALKKTAGTSTDLNTMAPGTYSQPYSTPLSGQGKPGPLDGQQNANAPAGAAPYNGAEPKGHTVVPGHNATPPKAGPSDDRPAQKNMYDGPLNKGRDNSSGNGSSLSGQTLAFRQRVQAALLAETPIEE